MTDYDKMTDDALSAAVAEKVMGWTYLRDVAAWTTRDLNGVLRVHAVAGPVASFQPAASWSDAGRVLEKMRADGWDCLIEIEGTMEGGPQSVSVDFSRPDRSGNATAATAARAICIAALRAVEARA